jgi:hypothetical protein
MKQLLIVIINRPHQATYAPFYFMGRRYAMKNVVKKSRAAITAPTLGGSILNIQIIGKLNLY